MFAIIEKFCMQKLEQLTTHIYNQESYQNILYEYRLISLIAVDVRS